MAMPLRPDTAHAHSAIARPRNAGRRLLLLERLIGQIDRRERADRAESPAAWPCRASPGPADAAPACRRRNRGRRGSTPRRSRIRAAPAPPAVPPSSSRPPGPRKTLATTAPSAERSFTTASWPDRLSTDSLAWPVDGTAQHLAVRGRRAGVIGAPGPRRGRGVAGGQPARLDKAVGAVGDLDLHHAARLEQPQRLHRAERRQLTPWHQRVPRLVRAPEHRRTGSRHDVEIRRPRETDRRRTVGAGAGSFGGERRHVRRRWPELPPASPGPATRSDAARPRRPRPSGPPPCQPRRRWADRATADGGCGGAAMSGNGVGADLARLLLRGDGLACRRAERS